MPIMHLQVSLLVIVSLCKSCFNNILISIFGSALWNSFGRPNSAEDVVSQTCDDGAGEEVETVDMCCADGNCLAYSTSETNDDKDVIHDLDISLTLEEK